MTTPKTTRSFHFGISFVLYIEVPILVSKIDALTFVGARYFFASSTARKNESETLTVGWFTRGVHVLTKSCTLCLKVRMQFHSHDWTDLYHEK
jgi:hypothetical protein